MSGADVVSGELSIDVKLKTRSEGEGVAAFIASRKRIAHASVVKSRSLEMRVFAHSEGWQGERQTHGRERVNTLGLGSVAT